jgi:hypothetical protein
MDKKDPYWLRMLTITALARLRGFAEENADVGPVA